MSSPKHSLAEYDLSKTGYFFEDWNDGDIPLDCSTEKSWGETYNDLKDKMEEDGFGRLNATYNAARGTLFQKTFLGYPSQKFSEHYGSKVQELEDEEELAKVAGRGLIMTFGGLMLGFGSAAYGMTQQNIPPEVYLGVATGIYSNLKGEVEWHEAKQILEDKSYFENDK